MSEDFKPFYFFWQGYLSQWHPASFTVGANRYNCAEQFMMYSKAVLFKDAKAARAILSSSSPKEQKAIGRSIQGFDESLWEACAEDIVYLGTAAKFSQNFNLFADILKTSPLSLVEASPKDEIWGIGLSSSDPRVLDPSQWQGQNKLGKILTRFRNEMVDSPAVVFEKSTWIFQKIKNPAIYANVEPFHLKLPADPRFRENARLRQMSWVAQYRKLFPPSINRDTPIGDLVRPGSKSVESSVKNESLAQTR